MAHFKFLGQIFGHLARAKSPLPIDVSLIVWKHLVTDTVTIEDFYTHVESSWRGFIDDEDLLAMGESKNDPMAAELLEYFPNFFEELAKLQSVNVQTSSNDTSGMLNNNNAPPPASPALRKKAAENCVLNSITPQMDALRSGVWEIQLRSPIYLW